MIVPTGLIAAYDQLQTPLRVLHTRAKQSLATLADANRFPMFGRIKSIESLLEKVEGGWFSNLSDIDDLVAFTLIVPTRRQAPDVIRHCKDAFDVLRIKEKSDYHRPPETFWFDSTRIAARLRPVPGDPAFELVPNQDDQHSALGDITFEVQILTAFEHAWSTATHDFAYKSGRVDWNRLRLAWQLKATVEMLDTSIVSLEFLTEQSLRAKWSQLENSANLANVITHFIDTGMIPSEHHPKDMSRVCDNIARFVESISPPLSLNDACKIFSESIVQCKLGPLPLSLTLYQIFLVCICESDVTIHYISRPCHLTKEVMNLFPKTRALQNRFNYR
jgi:ppGpp synthetase/RelA/SpoT-type nucleotidyltranferase